MSRFYRPFGTHWPSTAEQNARAIAETEDGVAKTIAILRKNDLPMSEFGTVAMMLQGNLNAICNADDAKRQDERDKKEGLVRRDRVAKRIGASSISPEVMASLGEYNGPPFGVQAALDADIANMTDDELDRACADAIARQRKS